MKLCCAIVGKRGSVFTVDIDPEQSVKGLKNAIKDANEEITGDADKLQLFLAKKTDGSWLMETEIKGLVNSTTDLTYLGIPDAKLGVVGLSEEDVQVQADECHQVAARNGPEHVLVEVPETYSPNKRIRLGNSEKLENVPQVVINNGVKYVTLPEMLLEKCDMDWHGDLMLYCRPQVHELWNFLRDEVVKKKIRGFIVGPPGIGKSVCTLSFAASLDHEEWNVVWVHFGAWVTSCFVLGTKKYWLLDDLSRFELPRVVGKKRFLCVDRYKRTDDQPAFMRNIFAYLNPDDVFVTCSAMATLGETNAEDDAHVKMQYFFMSSWALNEYQDAITDQDFYATVADKFDGVSVSDVNDEDDDNNEELSEDDKKSRALAVKFYHAGGSCLLMFGYLTQKVKDLLKWTVDFMDQNGLASNCSIALHSDSTNLLFGTQYDSIGRRFPVNSYVVSLFAQKPGKEVLEQLTSRLNSSSNPLACSSLFEWYLLASVPKRAVELFVGRQAANMLPQARVLHFNPYKRFKTLTDRQIEGNQSWLQPVAWHQGGYEAMYFDTETGEVIFIQAPRSDRHDFETRCFHDVLLKLQQAGMQISTVVVYCVVNPTLLPNFELSSVDDLNLLQQFDASWTGPVARSFGPVW